MLLIALVVIVFWILLPGLITGWMLRESGRSYALGLALGAVCGPIAILATLVLIIVINFSAGNSRRAYRSYYVVPLFGRLHTSTVWAMAGVATFVCLWVLGGLVYTMYKEIPLIEQEQEAPVTASASQTQLAPRTETVAPSPQAQPTPTFATAEPRPQHLPMITGLAPPPSQTGQLSINAPTRSALQDQPSLEAGMMEKPTQPTVSQSPPAARPNQRATASLEPSKPNAPDRQAVVSEVTRSLVRMGYRVHTSISGDAQTTTLALTGPTLTREAGNQWLGNKRIRDALKAVGIRIVTMLNSQESWTYIL